MEEDTNLLIDHLYAYTKNNTLDVIILGPVKPPVSKIKTIHSRKIFIKADDFGDILRLCQQVNKKKYVSSIYFTPNPLT